MTEFFYALGRLFQALFKVMDVLGQFPNYLIIAIIVVLFFVWLKMQADYSKEAEEKGTLK